MEKQPPKVLTEAGLSMFVDTVKLRELHLPIIDLEIEKLLWHFDMPVWAKDGTEDWNLTPFDVINGVEGSLGHKKRAEQADLSFPLVVTNYNSRTVVLDGVHRLTKAYMQGDKSIKAKVIPADCLSLPEFQS